MAEQIFDFSQITDFEIYKRFVGKKKTFLGKGINGKVYKVYINKTMPIAVKKIDLPQNDLECSKQIENLEKEAALLKDIDHKNIVKVYFNFQRINSESNEKSYYIGMEYIEKDLEKLLKEKKKLTEFEISLLASQLQKALAYLETKKIVHRNLKPANILITSQGTYKLCDFSEYKWQEQTLKTFQNTLAGTPNYLSPELITFYQNQLKKRKEAKSTSNQLIYNPYKSDVFSFGLVLLQCLLGCHEIFMGVLNQNEDDLKELFNKKCSKNMKWFLSKCMSFNPNERLSFNEMSQIFQINPIEIGYNIFLLNEEISLLKKNAGQNQIHDSKIKQSGEENIKLKNEIAILNKKISTLQEQLSQFKKDLCNQKQRKTETYSGGDKYDGQFVNGKREGKGIYYWPDGQKYDGEFKNGKEEGKGIMYYPNGQKYDGEFKNGQEEGKGIWYWPDGQEYDGEFKNGKQEGKGIMSWPDGEKYDGEWKNGKQEGKGIRYYPNGDKYDGEWQNGYKEGKGIMSWADGEKYDGEWKNGEQEGKGIWYYPSGQKYDGEFKNGEEEGKGIMYYPDGDKYDGEWKDGKKEGKGIYYYTNGDKYDGKYYNDKREGKGIFYYANYTTETCFYKNGIEVN